MKMQEFKIGTREKMEDKIHQGIHDVFKEEFSDDVITSAFYSLPFHECVEGIYSHTSIKKDKLKQSIRDGLSKACEDLYEVMIKDGYDREQAIRTRHRIREALLGQ